MKIIEDNSKKRIRSVCTNCNSIIELYEGDLKVVTYKELEEFYYHCPCCKDTTTIEQQYYNDVNLKDFLRIK